MAVRNATRDPAIVQPAGRHQTRGSVAPSCSGLQPERSSSQEPLSLSSPRPIFKSAERLVQIWSSNEREIIELRVLRLKAARARAYLLSPGCNRLLGRACLQRLETQRHEHLARLRGNHQAACELMAEVGAEQARQAEPRHRCFSARAGDSLISDPGPHLTRCWSA
jgi:hypothetical protein